MLILSFKIFSRAYFRIQGKHPICVKRASYFGNISSFDYSTSMKIQSTSGSCFKQFIWFANTFMVYCSCMQLLISFWRFGEYLMMIETEIQRFFTLFIFKKITHMSVLNCKIHRKSFEKICSAHQENTSSHWIITFRKLQSYNLFLHEKVFTIGKIKIFIGSFSISSKLITPGLAEYHLG